METVLAVPINQESPQAMMMAAIDKGMDLDKLERFMSLQERYEANQARKEEEGMKKISGNCLSCKKHMTSSCAVLRDTGKRPNDNDWCYGYTKKKSTPTVRA